MKRKLYMLAAIVLSLIPFLRLNLVDLRNMAVKSTGTARKEKVPIISFSETSTLQSL